MSDARVTDVELMLVAIVVGLIVGTNEGCVEGVAVGAAVGFLGSNWVLY